MLSSLCDVRGLKSGEKSGASRFFEIAFGMCSCSLLYIKFTTSACKCILAHVHFSRNENFFPSQTDGLFSTISAKQR